PSGGGKSTHAKLWADTFGSRCVYVNDDKPFLSVRNGAVTVYGSPWNGKHHRGMNSSAPLKAVCFIEKAPENVLSPVSRGEVFPLLLRQTYRPYDPVANGQTVKLLSAAADGLSFWRMRCTISQEAALICASGMTGKAETVRNTESDLESTLRKDGRLFYGIRGDSMMPFLKQGQDIVKLEPVSGILQPLDLPLYRRPDGQLVLHRILEVDEKKRIYAICGDNRDSIEQVPFDWVIAVASGFYTNASRAKSWAGKDAAFDGETDNAGRVYVPADHPAYVKAVKDLVEDRKNGKLRRDELSPGIWKPLLILLRHAAEGTKAPDDLCPEDWEAVFKLAENHLIAALLYTALPENALKEMPEEISKAWKQASAKALRKELLFDRMREEVYRRLEDGKIPYLPLKGIRMKEKYPVKGTREFADHDILYDKARQEDVHAFMTELGFETISLVGVHDTYHMEPLYNFEFHKQLFADSASFGKPFKAVWEHAVPVGEGTSEYRMTDGWFYAYFLAHLHKHYAGGGSGLRSFTDLYLLEKTPLSADARKEADDLLQAAGLAESEKELTELTDLFFRTPVDEIPYEKIRYCLESGTYGTFTHRVVGGVKREGKFKYLMHRAFLPYSDLCGAYPVLVKAPVLLPFCWGARWVKCVFDGEKRQRAGAELKLARETRLDEDDD
ncbi:MAG: nucleotidyltransferase family protein, partial [Clostridia bacterium]|nr:nucleotidyltransferase family protein [Clostridia bacterium]